LPISSIKVFLREIEFLQICLKFEYYVYEYYEIEYYEIILSMIKISNSDAEMEIFTSKFQLLTRKLLYQALLK